jgi:hypothetical protein
VKACVHAAILARIADEAKRADEAHVGEGVVFLTSREAMRRKRIANTYTYGVHSPNICQS